ncbi:MAG: DUF1963 domain-containing protein [Candidatus Sericytochromatia bacterium]
MDKKYFYKISNNDLEIVILSFNKNNYTIKKYSLGQNFIKNIYNFSSEEECKISFLEKLNNFNKEYLSLESKIARNFIKTVNILANLEKLGYGKKTWIPFVENKKGTILDSKFGGIPYLKENETWPICGNCKEPMTFFLQINFDTINKDIKDEFKLKSGLFQLFHCTNWNLQCELSGVYNLGKRNNFNIIRILDLPKDNSYKKVKLPNKNNYKTFEKEIIYERLFPEKIISKWLYRGYEYPFWKKERKTIDLSNFKNKSLSTKNIPIFLIDYLKIKNDLVYENILFDLIYQDEKIGGEPYWIHKEEKGFCAECGKDLELLLQIGYSELNIPYMFDDAGIGYILFCKEHQENIYFYCQS